MTLFKKILRAVFIASFAFGLYACAASDPKTASADAQITEELRTDIFHSAELAGADISVQARDGIVYIRGLVDTVIQKDALESMARSVAGVKGVVNSVELRSSSR